MERLDWRVGGTELYQLVGPPFVWHRRTTATRLSTGRAAQGGPPACPRSSQQEQTWTSATLCAALHSPLFLPVSRLRRQPPQAPRARPPSAERPHGADDRRRSRFGPVCGSAPRWRRGARGEGPGRADGALLCGAAGPFDDGGGAAAGRGAGDGEGAAGAGGHALRSFRSLISCRWCSASSPADLTASDATWTQLAFLS